MSVLHQMLEVKERWVKQRKELGEQLLGRWMGIEDRLSSAKPGANHSHPWQGNNVGPAAPAEAGSPRSRPVLAEVSSEPLKASAEGNIIWGDWFFISQQIINDFGAVTRDQQWIHVDEDRAAEESPYKSTVAHGFLLLSLIPTLIPKRNWQALLGREPTLIINIGLDSARFVSALKSNSHIRASSRTLTVTAIKRGYRVVEEITLKTRPDKTIASARMIYRLVCDSPRTPAVKDSTGQQSNET